MIDVSIGYLLENVPDFDKACSVIGLNPWCMNEGLATKDDLVSITFEQAKEKGKR